MGFTKKKYAHKKPQNDPTEEINKLKMEMKAKEELLKAAEEKLADQEKKLKKNEKLKENLKEMEEKMKFKGAKLKEKDIKLKEFEEKLKKKKSENLLLTEEIKDLKDESKSRLTPNPKSFSNDESPFEHFFMNEKLFKKLIRQVLTLTK